MSWQPNAIPQRLTPCGLAGMPYAGRSLEATASEKPIHAGRRAR